MGKRFDKKLTARGVATLKKPGRHSDGDGLYLAIDRKGRRRWVFIYVRNGKRTELGLGGRDLTLAEARDAADTHRDVLKAHGDPKAERQKERDHKVKTFGECADDYIETMRPSWRNAKHAAQWKMTLTEYASNIRDLNVADVDTDHILGVLQKIWFEKPETARRLRGRIERVLDWAKVKKYRPQDDPNPARWRGHMAMLLPDTPPGEERHHKALPVQDMPAFITDLRDREAMSARALEFTILTAVRTSEVLGARWSEIDLDTGVWIIPASRMKIKKREHRVPLSGRAIAILEDVKTVKSGNFVFPGPKPKTPLSSGAMSAVLKRMKVEVTVHGFRSTFRDWASETTGFSHEVCEMALAHTIKNKAEAAYRRGDLFDKRRDLMEAWASYCEELNAENVVPLHGLQ